MTLLSYKLQKNKSFSDHRIVPRIGLETSRKSFQIFCLLFFKIIFLAYSETLYINQKKLTQVSMFVFDIIHNSKEMYSKRRENKISVFFRIHGISTLKTFLSMM